LRARENLIDAVRMMQEPVDLDSLPTAELVTQEIEV